MIGYSVPQTKAEKENAILRETNLALMDGYNNLKRKTWIWRGIFLLIGWAVGYWWR